jgi:hypothetical protein
MCAAQTLKPRHDRRKPTFTREMCSGLSEHVPPGSECTSSRTGAARLTHAGIVEPLDDGVVGTRFNLVAREAEGHDARVAFEPLASNGGLRLGGG